MGLRVISKQAPRQTMGTGQSPHAIVERPQSIEHGAGCKSAGGRIEWQVRDGIRRMIAIIEEAGGSLGSEDLRRRMDETGGSKRFFEIYAKASLDGLVRRDERCVYHVPKEYPAPSPEERARHDTYLKAERLGVVRWSGGRRIVVPGDPCPFSTEELKTIREWIRAGEAIAESAEVDRMSRRCLEGKATEAELDACMRKVARQATEPQLQEQREPRRQQARKIRR